MAGERLEPKGKKVARIEAVAELEVSEAIQVEAERLSGVRAGTPVPPGFKGDAIRLLIAAGADALGISAEANSRAQKIRERESRE